jgi:hypothetical protein
VTDETTITDALSPQSSVLSPQSWFREALGALVVLLVAIHFAPATPWESDEMLFASSVLDFNPAAYHPHPPGFPLVVLLGKFVFGNFVHDPWRALQVINILAAPLGFIVLTRLFRRLIGDADLAACGALVFYFSTAFLVNGTLAMSDGIALTFLIVALLALSEVGDVEHHRAAIIASAFASAAIGCRPQLVIPLAPLLLFALFRMRNVKERIASVVTFTIVSLLWFLPLVDACGSFGEFIAYERHQASYFVVHDAAMSRGAKSSGEIFVRFLLHPWGSKYITLPLIVVFLLGIVPAWRRRRDLLPLALFTAVQIAFELATMDPADAARYALPSMIFIACIVAFGFGVIRASMHVRLVPLAGALLFAAMSFAYVRTILDDRIALPSPPFAAAAYAKAHFAANTVILPDPSMRPAAELLLPRFTSMPIEKGIRDYFDQPSVPLVLYVDGGSGEADSRVFAWHPSDAYGKLTRNHYLRVTLDTIDPEERYLPLRGVYALERTIAGEEWRWLARDAAIRLPKQHGSSVELRFRLSPDAPYETNGVTIAINGAPSERATVRRAETTPILLPLPAGDCVVTMHADQSFLPAAVLHNRDPRELAVQLAYVRMR